jgi:hypothetical protein
VQATSATRVTDRILGGYAVGATSTAGIELEGVNRH